MADTGTSAATRQRVLAATLAFLRTIALAIPNFRDSDLCFADLNETLSFSKDEAKTKAAVDYLVANKKVLHIVSYQDKMDEDRIDQIATFIKKLDGVAVVLHLIRPDKHRDLDCVADQDRVARAFSSEIPDTKVSFTYFATEGLDRKKQGLAKGDAKADVLHALMLYYKETRGFVHFTFVDDDSNVCQQVRDRFRAPEKGSDAPNVLADLEVYLCLRQRVRDHHGQMNGKVEPTNAKPWFSAEIVKEGTMETLFALPVPPKGKKPRAAAAHPSDSAAAAQ